MPHRDDSDDTLYRQSRKREGSAPSCFFVKRALPPVHLAAVLKLLLLLCLWGAPAIIPSGSAQSKPEKPVAIAGDEKFYENDYLPQLQSELFKIRVQEFQLKRKALEQAINKRLLQAEADKR